MSGHLIERYLEAIAAEQGAARNTLAAYGHDLSDFARYCARHDAGLDDVMREGIETYLSDCEQAGLSIATRARRLTSIRRFFRFLYLEGIRSDDPAAHIRGARPARSLPTTLQESDVERMLSLVRDPQAGIRKVRDTALVELLYATGLRVTELVSLPVAAFAGQPEMILIKGKGGRERMVPLSDPALRAVDHWLKDRSANRKWTGSPWLFPSGDGRKHLTRQSVFLMLKKLAARAGLDPSSVSPHVIRHAFATHLLSNGADLRAIQMLLGHADLGTTEIYTHVVDDRMRELVLEKHPLAQFVLDDPA